MLFPKSSRLIFRPWRERDIPALRRLANNRKISRWLKDSFPHPYTVADARAWIRESRQAQTRFALAIEWQKQVIGGIGLHPRADVYRFTWVLGYWLGEPYWGQGFATEAVQAVTEWGFRKHPIRRIQAGIFSGNRASMGVLKKCGFTLEARHRKSAFKDGKFLDEYLFVKLNPKFRARLKSGIRGARD